MEDYSFNAADMEKGTRIELSLQDVEQRLGTLAKEQDLKKFIL